MLHLTGYAIETRLRATATGELFWATREQDGGRVLLKVYEAMPGTAWDQGQREQALLEKVRSDHVLPCVELAQHGDRVVLAMRAVRGVSLRDHLQGARPRDLASFLRVAIQLVRILADVHTANLVLRDLAPERFLIDPVNLRLWLLDLDGAVDRQRVATASDSRGLREGLAYMAPEGSGRMGRTADARSDLYALGAMLYELLLGAPPFAAVDIVDLVHAHMTLTPAPPDELDPAIPPVISRLVMTLLAKMPEERYQSAHGLHRDLLALERRLARTGSLDGVSLQRLSERAEIRVPARLYGRARESAHLTVALQAARAGRPQLVLLAGPPGVGKSALVDGLSEMLRHRGYLIQGKCDALHVGRPYEAFRIAFDALVDQLAAESEERLSACREALQAQLGAIAGALTEVVPRIELLLGAPAPVPALGPAETRTRLALACRRFVDAIASAERPLVLFLDDLQWADSGSLHLIETLYEARSTHLLLIGTLPEEPDELSPQAGEMLGRLRAGPGRLTELRLAPLGSVELQHLLADTLGCTPQAAAPLAALILRKTDGNPFLVRQFLDYARRRELFTFDEIDGWIWDIDALEQAGIPDDAVGLMKARLALLEPAIRAVLAAAACIGSELDRATLAAALGHGDGDGDEAGLDAALAALQAQGLIAATRTGYAFTHDEIQEAAYRELAAAERQERHLRIGRSWLAELRRGADGVEPAQSRRLFAVVEQLHDAIELITDAAERIELATLDWHACLRAMRSAAYGAAHKYAQAGAALVRDEPWDAHDWLRFRLHLELAESAFLLGEPGAPEEQGASDAPGESAAAGEPGASAGAFAALAALATLPLDAPRRLVLATRTVRMYQMAHRHAEAVRVGLAVLQSQGVTLPPEPRAPRVMQQFLATQLAFWRRPEHTLHRLPTGDDPLHLLRMNVLVALMKAAFWVSPALYFCLSLVGIRWTLRHGVAPEGPGMFAALALVRMGMGQLGRGRRLLTAARQMEAQAQARGAALSGQDVAFFIAELWFDDIRTLDAAMRAFYQRAIEHGEMELAANSETARLHCHFHRGTPLRQLIPELHALQQFCDANALSKIGRATAAQADQLERLAAERGDPCTLGLDAAEEDSFTFPVRSVHLGLVLALMGEWERLYELAESSESRADRLVFGTPHMRVFRLLHAMAAMIHAAAQPRSRAAQRRCRQIVRKCRRLLARWAAHSDVHAPHYLALLDAEAARLGGRMSEAMQRYAQAREHAAREEALPLQALIDERRASLAQELGLGGDALAYLASARDAYRAWGAGAKVHRLERAHPALQASAAPREAGGKAAPSPLAAERAALDLGKIIDLKTVLRASQAIAEEVTLDHVLERAMQSALESSGASKGVLALLEDGQAVVEAEIAVDAGFTRHASAPVAGCGALLPLAVWHYVERTGRAVIVADATQDARFASDPYVLATGCRSVLCLPLYKQQRRSGGLYLENRLVSGAFTEDRLEILRLLGGQAVIAIDNVRLYEELDGLTRDLEALVDERTAELASTNARLEREIAERTRAQEELIALQRRLVDTARAAGMAEIATGVLHNVGNLLNSVNVSVEVLRERMESSRLPALAQALELLQANQGALDRFLAEDERGRQLMPFLGRLIGRLDDERTGAIGEIDALQQHLGSIDEIVRKQQQYAKASNTIDTCHADELVADALALAGASLQRSGISVVTTVSDGEEPPPVLVDRHKALQILANLLSNAEQALRDAGAPDKRITISTAGDERGRVRIRVADNGHGIAPEHIEKLFTHGFTTRQGGHGFGLHNSFLAARSMHGMLRVHSDGPGRGAVFELELPASKAAHPDLPEPVDEKEPPSEEHRCR